MYALYTIQGVYHVDSRLICYSIGPRVPGSRQEVGLNCTYITVTGHVIRHLTEFVRMCNSKLYQINLLFWFESTSKTKSKRWFRTTSLNYSGSGSGIKQLFWYQYKCFVQYQNRLCTGINPEYRPSINGSIVY